MLFFRYLALPVILAMFAAPANAAQLVYQISGVGTTISFALDIQPGVKSVEVDGFVIGDVAVQINGISQIRDIGFVRELSDGGFLILGTNINLAGPQLFSGGFAAPTLLTGDFALTGFTDRTLTYSLQVAPAVLAVPEPSTWLLLLASFGMLGGAMRRRRPAGLLPST